IRDLSRQDKSGKVDAGHRHFLDLDGLARLVPSGGEAETSVDRGYAKGPQLLETFIATVLGQVGTDVLSRHVDLGGNATEVAGQTEIEIADTRLDPCVRILGVRNVHVEAGERQAFH